MAYKKFTSTKDIARMSTEEVQRHFLICSGSLTQQNQAKLYEQELKNRRVPIIMPNLCGGGSGHVPGTPKE